jgi:hypothetical protein
MTTGHEALLISKDDPLHAEVAAGATALFQAALRMGLAAPGCEKEQALYMACVALINAASLDGWRVLESLGAICGSAAMKFAGPEAAVAMIAQSAERYIEEIRQREFLTDAAPQGTA